MQVGAHRFDESINCRVQTTVCLVLTGRKQGALDAKTGGGSIILLFDDARDDARIGHANQPVFFHQIDVVVEFCRRDVEFRRNLLDGFRALVQRLRMR